MTDTWPFLFAFRALSFEEEEDNVNLSRLLLLALLIPLQAFAQQKFIHYWGLSETPPVIDQGGRANTIAVNPDNRDEMFVASDSGGLFKSIDRGVRWTHVDTLPVIFLQSVAYVDSNVILVSATADFKSTSGGGVWRSTDHGDHWTRCPLSNTPLNAYEISGMFGA